MHAGTAWAEDIETNPEADEFQQEVERTAAEYEDAKARLAQAEKDAADNAAQIESLNQQIPEQQKRSDAAARELYKMGRQRSGLINLLLNSDNFYDLLENLNYINRISDNRINELVKLSEMKTDLETHQVALEKAQADAKKETAEAKKALEAAQELRAEAQLRAQEEAIRQAEEAAAARAAEEEARKAQEAAKPEAKERKQDDSQQKPNGSSDAAENKSSSEKEDDTRKSAEADSKKDEGNSVESQEKPKEDAPADASANEPTNDGANWSDDQAAFISEWSGRINAYLAGSALEGQGENFAKAAWTYGVDPRWSPAIAFTESTLGANCFHPYNAWGWGDVSWSSWDEAIDAHVRGLARGYGYTISIENAQKYCPPNWENWYNNTLDQMNKM